MPANLDSMKIPDEKKKYIETKLNPILTELVTECLRSCPDEPIKWMIGWLSKRDGAEAKDLEHENEKLKEEVKNLVSSLKEAGGMLANLSKGDAEQEEEEDDEEEDDDDEPDELPEHILKMKQQKGARQSVSAEAYGAWNKKREFTPKVIAKSESQRDRLRKVLSKSFMFSSEVLDDDNFNVVINAMEERTFDAGVRIITQGDDGDYLFVIEEGRLECYKDDPVEGEKVVKTCEPGDVFGELALLYNTTRAANVRSIEKCVLWRLDRETFNAIVKDAAAQKRQRYESFLQSVTILKDMTGYELSQIADALKTEVYEEDSSIVTEGESGDRFFIVEAGNPVAMKSGQVVMQYKEADYFGELALLMEQPRLATVKAQGGPCKVLSLDRKSFKRLLGPLDQIMRRAMDKYTSPKSG